MRMDIEFPGGLLVAARFEWRSILTDQPRELGGSGLAPAPFEHFLAAIGTCAGIYALRFCQERDIPTHGLGLTLETEPVNGGRRVGVIRLLLQLPPEFPEKYRPAILRAVDQCAVKRHIIEPPHFEVALVDSAVPAGV
jgi:ribosomal protein S12 methylthiotransferase accessory factor